MGTGKRRETQTRTSRVTDRYRGTGGERDTQTGGPRLTKPIDQLLSHELDVQAGVIKPLAGTARPVRRPHNDHVKVDAVTT